MTLRVTLEIVPFGIEENKRTIHQINISNIGKSSGQSGGYSYLVELDKEHKFIVTNHNRENGALRLLEKVLADAPSLCLQG